MTKAALTHAPMEQFQVENNALLIGGFTARQLAEQVGSTPFYAYDSAVIAAAVARLKQALPDTLQLHYAIKANPMPEVVQLLSGLVCGLDVASEGELEIALATGTDPRHISFAGPGKSDADLAAAVATGVIINLESAGEMQRVAAQAELQGRRPRVAVRVNPAFELKTSGMKMGGGPKPFGIDEECVPELLGQLGELDLDFVGFHIFSGSQNLRPEAIVEAMDKTFELALRLSDSAPSPPRWLNLGGGLGVPYFPGEQRLDLAPISAALAGICARTARSLPEAALVMELGRYLVAEAGVYICEVIDCKDSRGQRYVVSNGGLHHHLAASGNFGQVLRKNYPLCAAHQVNAEHVISTNVVGPLCTPLDILAEKYPLPPLQRGDLLAVMQSGAYGYSASPHQFLGHPAPGQILV